MIIYYKLDTVIVVAFPGTTNPIGYFERSKTNPISQGFNIKVYVEQQ